MPNVWNVHGGFHCGVPFLIRAKSLPKLYIGSLNSKGTEEDATIHYLTLYTLIAFGIDSDQFGQV